MRKRFNRKEGKEARIYADERGGKISALNSLELIYQ